LARAEHVHLQGWGEPLLHPGLQAMVRDAKNAGCTVGVTTNGDLLHEAAEELLDQGLDLLSLSIAGARVFNPVLRGGVPFEEMLRRMEAFQERKTRGGHKTTLKVSYLLTRDNAAELVEATEAVARAGADECYVIHLDCVVSASLFDQAVFSSNRLESVRAAFRAAQKAASCQGLPLRLPSLEPEDVLACALNPVAFVFIAQDGRVGPCVNQLFSSAGPWTRWGTRGAQGFEPVVYGRLGRQSLDEIVDSLSRTAFLEPFRRRMQAEQAFLRGVTLPGERVSIRAIEESDAAREALLEANPFPDACSGCPKRWGW